MKTTHPEDLVCISLVLPNSLLRLGLASALSRLGVLIHQSDTFDPITCHPRVLIVEPLHLPECTLLYPSIPTLTVSLFESAVAATPATTPEDVTSRVRKLLSPLPSYKMLTDRERQILGLIASGSTTDEVAEACFISREAVRTHIKRVYAKLGAHNRASAVATATHYGVLV